jgi:two-component SAPR family response regulator
MKKQIAILMVTQSSAFETTITTELQRARLLFSIRRVDATDPFLHELQCHRPDVIISDCAARPFDGLAALTVASDTRPDLPFIFVTPPDEEAVFSANNGVDVLRVPLSKLIGTLRQELRKANARFRLKEMELMVLTERWAVVRTPRPAVRPA